MVTLVATWSIHNKWCCNLSNLSQNSDFFDMSIFDLGSKDLGILQKKIYLIRPRGNVTIYLLVEAL